MARIIPCLLVDRKGLYKTINFKNPRYLGDPFNTIRLFNGKEVDEIIVLDFGASRDKMKPDYDMIRKLASECFMPVCYGGGLNNIYDVDKVFKLGVDKVSFNTALHENIDLVQETIKRYGSQSVVASIDFKKTKKGYRVFILNGRKKTTWYLHDFCKYLEKLGVGELMLTSIDKEGTYSGYDDVSFEIANIMSIPVTVNGGAGSLDNMLDALERGASAASAGSLFAYYGNRKAVIPNYPSFDELNK